MHRRRFVASILVTCSLLMVPAQAFGLTSHTQAEIDARWVTAKPNYTGTPYAVVPSVTATYVAGELRPEYVADGLRMLNFVRYLAGLPEDVTIDADYASKSQHAAVLLAKTGTLNHNPTQPFDMPDAFYQLGLTGCQRSNIAQGPTAAEDTVLLYMQDGAPINLLGHRRLVLDPRMAKTGFGYAAGFSAMWWYDQSRPTPVDYDYVAWPPAGPFPVDDPDSGTHFFDANTAWSITLNPARYDWNVVQGFNVTVRRISDGTTWTMDSGDTNPSGEYFNVDTQNYGVPNCVIFRPNPSTFSTAPGEYEVTLGGALHPKGSTESTTVTYRTRFFSLGAPVVDTTLAVEPIEGPTRFDTAVQAVKKAFPTSASTVVIAWGRNFPDALGASALCGAYDAPLLLTETGYIPQVVRDEIKALGASHAIIVGSDRVVSKAVADDLGTLLTGGKQVDRIYGGGRYDTAKMVAAEVARVAGHRSDFFLAVGDNFPDALAASPAAFDKRWPIVLTARNALSQQAIDSITALDPARVHILGSTGAVPGPVADQLKARFPGITVDRWQGGTRYQTAIDIAQKSGLPWTATALATGDDFPDALAGGVMQGKLRGVVLLTPRTTLNVDTQNALVDHASEIQTVRYLGSTSAVSQAVRDKVSQVLK